MTKILAFIIILFAYAPAAYADKIKLDNAPISNVVRLYFSEINQDSYHLSDEIIKDDRRVSLSIEGDSTRLRNQLTAILRGYGYELSKVDGMYAVYKIPAALAAHKDDEREVFIYRPKARTSQYLVDVVRHLYPGVSQSAQGLPNTPPVTGEYDKTSATAQLDNRSDRIVFKGLPAEVRDLKRQLAVLDVPSPSIELQVFLIEHSNNKDHQTGFSALIQKIGGFSLSVGSVPVAGDVIKFSSGAVQLALSALKSDNKFSVYTSPKLLLVDRKKSRLVVGQDVPVLTATTSTQQGITQSIEYRSSGVIMEATANILDEAIEIDSTIEVSSFSRTTTGVSLSPTLTKRMLQTSTNLTDGVAVLFGGLNSASQNEGSSGVSFFPKFLRSNSNASDDSELFVLMTAKRI